MGFYSKLNLLMPVYRGGDLFLGAVNSVELSSISFENIFISFNGSDPSDYDAFIALKNTGQLKNKYTTFRTFSDFTAAEHGCFILDKIKYQLLPDSIFMQLAHDDRIVQQSDGRNQQVFFNSLRADTVYFPSYWFCSAGNYETVKFVSEDVSSHTVKQFFKLTMKKNIMTNVSGMIMPFSAYEAAVDAGRASGTGARAEFLCCVSPNVRWVNFTNNISVLIGEREDSDGKKLSLVEHRRSALAYVWRYFKNGHLGRCGGYCFFIYHFLIKLAAYFVAVIKNKANVRLNSPTF